MITPKVKLKTTSCETSHHVSFSVFLPYSLQVFFSALSSQRANRPTFLSQRDRRSFLPIGSKGRKYCLELQGELRSYIWCSFGVTYISVFCTVVDLILFLSSTATVYCNLLVKFSNLRPKCLYCNGPNL